MKLPLPSLLTKVLAVFAAVPLRASEEPNSSVVKVSKVQTAAPSVLPFKKFYENLEFIST